MKPLALVERAIENSSRSGDLVLDLFLGSGSTLIAAERKAGAVANVSARALIWLAARFASFAQLFTRPHVAGSSSRASRRWRTIQCWSVGGDVVPRPVVAPFKLLDIDAQLEGETLLLAVGRRDQQPVKPKRLLRRQRCWPP